MIKTVRYVIAALALATPVNADPYRDFERNATCLAANMYHEARGQTIEEQIAISHVVMNRVKDKRYPNNICKVITQGPVRESWKTRRTPNPNDAVYYPVKNRCQFSWWCDGKSDIPKDIKTWKEIHDLARRFLYNYNELNDFTHGATHYHAHYVRPQWSRKMKLTLRMRGHKFYR